MKRVSPVHLSEHLFSSCFIDDRLVKVMLQRWFTRVCEDPILLTDEEVRSFVESDFGVSIFTRSLALPQTSLCSINQCRVQSAKRPLALVF